LKNEVTGSPPSKFMVAIDDGGAWSLAALDADVRVLAAPAGWLVFIRGIEQPVGFTAAALDVIVRCAQMCADSGERTSEVWAAQLHLDQARAADPSGAPASGLRRLGRMAHPNVNSHNVIAAPFLGQLDVATMTALADLVDTHEIAMRITPDHSIAFCGVDNAIDLARALLALGLVTDPADPRGLVSACVGSRGCASATGDTWAEAERRVALGETKRLHLSGCLKGCGAPREAPVLTADEVGSFR
jgi:precorrin-3B synthase